MDDEALASHQGLAAIVAQLVDDPTRLVPLQKLAALGTLGAGIVHETRNLMTAVLSLSQVGKRRAATQSNIAELFVRIEAESLRCLDALNVYLDAVRGAGKPGTARPMEPVEIDRLVRSMGSLVAHRFQMSRVRLEVEAADDLPVIPGRADELKQVVLNLLINAMQATPQGGNVRLVATCAAGGGVAITVADTGPGIPSPHRERIFEAFYTTKPAGAGTGLGLAIARQIALDHGGSLELDESTAAGSTFALRLPGAV